MNLNLGFAILWLVTAVVLFATPGASIPLGDARIPGGWVALLLGLYNVARWWSIRSARRQRQAEQEAQARLARRRRPEEPGAPAEPDPNFNFTDPPADAKGGPPPP